jgi:hypothetical protein
LIKANSLLASMDSGFAAGWLRSRSHTGKDRYRYDFDIWTAGIHQPLISPEVWEAYKARRARSRELPTRLRHAKYSMSGLVFCECGSRMVAAKTASVTTWRCAAQQDTKSCPVLGTSARVSVIEGVVWDWVREHASGEELAALEMRRIAESRRALSRVEQYDVEIRRLKDKRRRLADALTDELIEPEDYVQQRDDIARALELATAARLSAEGERRLAAIPSSKVFQGLESAWSGMSEHDRREALTQVIAKVVVRKGHHTLPGKYTVVPRWLAEAC